MSVRKRQGSQLLKQAAAITLGRVSLSLPACAWYARSAPRPETLGIHGTRLFHCPSRPYCVSSFEDGGHAIETLSLRHLPESAMQALAKTLSGMDGATVVTRTHDYLHGEFRTPWLGFVDDVEFLVDPPRGVIHVRSASRRGYSDLGTNRKRVEAIRASLADAAANGEGSS